MADKVQLIKEEIERRIKEGSSKNDISEGALALNSLLDFIGSLPEEPASDDLEEYYKKEFLPKEWFAKPGQRTISKFNFFTAKHFAEWQKKQMKETLQTEYEKGRFDMREEMMKDAVDATILDVDAQTIEFGLWPENLLDIKEGDKVKIIIVKEEQQ